MIGDMQKSIIIKNDVIIDEHGRKASDDSTEIDLMNHL